MFELDKLEACIGGIIRGDIQDMLEDYKGIHPFDVNQQHVAAAAAAASTQSAKHKTSNAQKNIF